jgi:prepilin-type processing-associated H-X9-DG protein
MFVAGTYVQRDSDMQAKSIGEAIEPGEKYEYLERGDLVFWDGHVAIVEDNKTLIHANGYTMSVVREPLAAAIKRIEGMYGKPTLYKRP